jgi:alpha-L-fucosidase 2
MRNNRRMLNRITVAASLGLAAGLCSAAESPLRIWLDKPAAKWEAALPLGNGRLGAMVFSGTTEERLQLNECTLWGGQPGDYANPEAGKHLAEVRRLIFAGKISEAENLGGNMLGNPPFQLPYQPLGDLRLRFPGHEKAEHYVRALDLDQAIATTTYQIGEVEFKREVFVSHPDQAMVIRLSSSKPGRISFETGLDTPHPGIQTEVIGKDTLRLSGQLLSRPGGENWSNGWEKPGLKFEARLRIAIEGGNIEGGDRVLKVRDANAVTLVLCAATSFKNYRDVSADPKVLVERQMTAACGKTIAQLRQNHLTDYLTISCCSGGWPWISARALPPRCRPTGASPGFPRPAIPHWWRCITSLGAICCWPHRDRGANQRIFRASGTRNYGRRGVANGPAISMWRLFQNSPR